MAGPHYCAAQAFRLPSTHPSGRPDHSVKRVCLRTLIGLAFGFVKIVYRAENIIDANLVKAALAEAGIQAFVAGEYLTGGVGTLPAMDFVTVMVAETDVERAAPIAEEIDSSLKQSREAGDRRDPGGLAPA
jgi:Putative prokaryotic signal transducing protein